MCVCVCVGSVQRGVEKLRYYENYFLRTFAKFLKTARHLSHVCPSVHMEQLGPHWTDFHEI